MLQKNGWIGKINYTKTGVSGEKSKVIDPLEDNSDNYFCKIKEDRYCSQCGQKIASLAFSTRFCYSCGAKI